MTNPEKPNNGPYHHLPEISALLKAGQMPKGLSPANLPDIDVTAAFDAARMITEVPAIARPKAPDHPAGGYGKSQMPRKGE